MLSKIANKLHYVQAGQENTKWFHRVCSPSQMAKFMSEISVIIPLRSGLSNRKCTEYFNNGRPAHWTCATIVHHLICAIQASTHVPTSADNNRSNLIVIGHTKTSFTSDQKKIVQSHQDYYKFPTQDLGF